MHVFNANESKNPCKSCFFNSGVESFVQARHRLLSLTPTFVALPDKVKSMYEDPASSYNIGWSHGKEALVGGKRDIFKGV